MVSVVPQNKYSIFSPLRFTDTSQYGRVSPVIGGYGVNDPPPSRYGEKGSRHANLRCKKKEFLFRGNKFHEGFSLLFRSTNYIKI